MADTASLENREQQDSAPKSFAEAVANEVPIEETASAKTDKPHSENMTDRDEGGQANGLKMEEIEKTEPIPTEGIANDKVKVVENGEIQKAELGEKGEKQTNGVDAKDQEKVADATGKESDSKSYAEAAVNPPPEQVQSPLEMSKEEKRPLHHSRSPSFTYRIPKAASVVSFRSGYAEQFDDSEFEDNDSLIDNYAGDRLTSVRTRTPLTPRSPSMTKLKQAKQDSENKDEDRSLVSGRIAGKNWQQSKIRFAPLNVPLQRRLQTFAVLYHTLALGIAISSFLFLCAIPLLWPLLIPYMIHLLFSKAGKNGKMFMRSDWMRRSKIWSAFASYFPMRLHRTAELNPNRKYCFGYHPHGIIGHGAFAAFATEALGFSQLFPGITNSLLTLDSNFRIPFYREYMLSLGIGSVARTSCEAILSRGGVNGEGMGRAITIVVGGARESLDAHPHTMKLTLKNRYGFVKMAIRTGADLVPVIGFGENDLYDQLSVENRPWIKSMQYGMKKVLGWTLPLFHARGVFNYDVGLLPYRRPVNIVVGRPIKVRQNRKPTMEEVERVHREYCQELVRIWETWKDDFAPDRKEEMKIYD